MNQACKLVEKGIEHYRIRSLDDAAAYLVRGLEVDPTQSEGWYFLGLTRHSQGRLAEAEEALTRVIELQKTRLLAAYKRRGYIRLDRGSLLAAAADFSTAIVISPDDWRSHNMLGLVQIEQEHPCRAAESFRQALALLPANADADAREISANLARALRLIDPAFVHAEVVAVSVQ